MGDKEKSCVGIVADAESSALPGFYKPHYSVYRAQEGKEIIVHEGFLSGLFDMQSAHHAAEAAAHDWLNKSPDGAVI
ncbi:hypothetical protein SAMN05216420_102131 [Nitrosospira sp. Nl5]|uniref:hypothetical protein n=1 Tax=Nitrosospira sp. Nl5 TaxID=200120 RepID=UPI0008915230|nr:hypothetical protein [Nitrosospira sp. Nl5]SCY05214.1 hypothetical protein SAMN05216420_102131 [Nitrosospira sp. Nl5]